eukprot:jgi/Ulvmu1/8861/UM049_0043.1
MAAAGAEEPGKLLLVAVDANWPGARRMMKSYEEMLPNRFVKLALPAGDVFAPGQEESMLAPIRKYRAQDDSFDHRACTAEAVAAALRHLEGPAIDGSPEAAAHEVVLCNLRAKVNGVLRQNGLVASDDLQSITRTWLWRGDAKEPDDVSDCGSSV